MAKYTVSQEQFIIETLIGLEDGMTTVDLVNQLRGHSNGKTFRSKKYSDASLKAKARRLSYECLENGIEAIFPDAPVREKKQPAKIKRAAERAAMLAALPKISGRKSQALQDKIKEAKEKMTAYRDGQRKAKETRAANAGS
mgnify:CR=1 FL=1|jgi:hypothetical protein